MAVRARAVTAQPKSGLRRWMGAPSNARTGTQLAGRREKAKLIPLFFPVWLTITASPLPLQQDSLLELTHEHPCGIVRHMNYHKKQAVLAPCRRRPEAFQ